MAYQRNLSINQNNVVNVSGSNITLTGSLTGSEFSGSRLQSTIISASNLQLENDLYVSGGLTVGKYLQLLPVAGNIIPSNQTASYIYTSGSTNDMYFTQYQPGTNFTNTTRLRWLESTLSTGLLHGGLLSTVNGTTTFSLTSGSGLIITYNASTGSDPYPTIKFVSWPAYVSQSLLYTGSAQITYISVAGDGQIIQSPTAQTFAEFKDRIVIGRVLHQSGSVTNGATNTPPTAYGLATSTADFIRAIGPLKINGHFLAASGSSLSLTKSAGDSYVEGRNYSTDPNIPNIVLAAADPAVTISKIYREHISASSPVIDTGVGGAGYTTVDPTLYQDANGNLQTVGGGNFTVQRVFWFPKAVNRALFVYYGQARYANLDDAIAGITTENFTEGDNTKGSAILVGFLVMRGNATDFDTPNAARIYQASTFRGGGAGGGGGTGGVTTLPAGSSSYVQFNDVGSFGADSRFTFDKITHTLTVTGTGSFSELSTGLLTASAAYISGNVGIGTTIPNAKLGVNGNTIISGNLTVTGSTTLSTVSGTTAQFISLTGALNGNATTATTATNIAFTSENTAGTRYLAFSAQTSGNGAVRVDTDLTYNPGTNTLTVSNLTASTAISGSNIFSTRVTGSFISGSQITGTMSGSYLGSISGALGQFTTITGSQISGSRITGSMSGSLLGTASFALDSNNLGGIAASGYVTTTTSQTISGIKTFTGNNVFSANQFFNSSLITGSSTLRLQTVSGTIGVSGSNIIGNTITGSSISASTYIGLPSATAAGSAGQIQFNTGSNVLGADSTFVWNNIDKRLSVGKSSANSTLDVSGNTIVSGNLTVTGYITGTTIFLGVQEFPGIGSGSADERANIAASSSLFTTGAITAGPYSDGNPAHPTYNFSTQPSTGMYYHNNNELGFAIGGNQAFRATRGAGYTKLAINGEVTPQGLIHATLTTASADTTRIVIENAGAGNTNLSYDLRGNQGLVSRFIQVPHNANAFGEWIRGAVFHVSGSDVSTTDTNMHYSAVTHKWYKNAGSGSADRIMTLNSSGNLGIGDSNPQERLVVNGNTIVSGNLTVTGSITELSTRRIKTNITSLNDELTTISKLNPVSYTRIDDGRREYGFISEEVKEVYPEFVVGEGINYPKMVSILVSAVKELTEKVENQSVEIELLKNKKKTTRGKK